MDLAALRAPTGVRAVLLDLQGHIENVDLLDNAGLVASRAQTVSAVGANLREEVIVRGGGQFFGEKGRAFMLGVSRLSANVAFSLSGRWSGLGRLDDVRGGWFGPRQTHLFPSDRRVKQATKLLN